MSFKQLKIWEPEQTDRCGVCQKEFSGGSKNAVYDEDGDDTDYRVHTRCAQDSILVYQTDQSMWYIFPKIGEQQRNLLLKLKELQQELNILKIAEFKEQANAAAKEMENYVL